MFIFKNVLKKRSSQNYNINMHYYKIITNLLIYEYLVNRTQYCLWKQV